MYYILIIYIDFYEFLMKNKNNNSFASYDFKVFEGTIKKNFL